MKTCGLSEMNFEQEWARYQMHFYEVQHEDQNTQKDHNLRSPKNFWIRDFCLVSKMIKNQEDHKDYYLKTPHGH